MSPPPPAPKPTPRKQHFVSGAELQLGNPAKEKRVKAKEPRRGDIVFNPGWSAKRGTWGSKATSRPRSLGEAMLCIARVKRSGTCGNLVRKGKLRKSHNKTTTKGRNFAPTIKSLYGHRSAMSQTPPQSPKAKQ